MWSTAAFKVIVQNGCLKHWLAHKASVISVKCFSASDFSIVETEKFHFPLFGHAMVTPGLNRFAESNTCRGKVKKARCR